MSLLIENVYFVVVTEADAYIIHILYYSVEISSLHEMIIKIKVSRDLY